MKEVTQDEWADYVNQFAVLYAREGREGQHETMEHVSWADTCAVVGKVVYAEPKRYYIGEQ